MSAVISLERDRVVVSVSDSLGFEIWPVLRDARKSAESTRLPLCINIEHCQTGDMAGIGSILLAQAKLPSVKLAGCHGIFFKCFHHFGICDHCSEDMGNTLGCAERKSNNAA
jgi:hypothetical protein